MTTIVIIRPGSTDYDQQRRIKGNLDIPMNAEGTQQVKDTVNQLAQQGLEAIYSSPCQSAEQTAQFIAERLGVKWKTLEQLANGESQTEMLKQPQYSPLAMEEQVVVIFAATVSFTHP